MSLAVIRKSPPLLNNFSVLSHSFLSPKCKLKNQIAGLITKAMRDRDYVRPPAFPYQQKEYGFIASIFDDTAYRFDENSKLIIVDGPVASGKDKLAENLADQFDMLYFPHANMDDVYINTYGHDVRKANPYLPKELQTFDMHEFLADPKDLRSTRMQYYLFKVQFIQYMNAMNHIFNTGQGVVMNRSAYSHIVFIDTFMKFGFLPKTYKEYFMQVFTSLRKELLRPHLIIYLDTPVDVILENIKKRKNPVEINSPVYKPEVLKELEQNYKFQFLQEMSTHSHLLVYDNAEGVDPEVVAEDMERLKLDDFDFYDSRLKDWHFHDEEQICKKRIEISRDRHLIEKWLMNIPTYSCEELNYCHSETTEISQATQKHVPGFQYAEGFNPHMGDSCLFKIGNPTP